MTKFTGIKAISFDGDQTLWDFQSVMLHSLKHVLKELEVKNPMAASRLDIPAMIAIRNRVADGLKGKITNLEKIRLEAFKETLRQTGHPDDNLAAHLNSIYLKHRFEDMLLYEDVMPVLQELAKKYKLGLLSNGNSYPDRCGLDGVFDFIVFSQDCGYEKPHPEFYRVAIEAAGCTADQLLHVGDSIENDVMGALESHINAIWLKRDSLSAGNLPSNVPVIGSLKELLDLV